MVNYQKEALLILKMIFSTTQHQVLYYTGETVLILVMKKSIHSVLHVKWFYGGQFENSFFDPTKARCYSPNYIQA